MIAAIISSIVSFVVGSILTWITTRHRKIVAIEKAEQQGIRELQRSKLIDYHDKYVERRYCPIYVKESATRCYESYHELGGNGAITQLYNELMALPTNPPTISETS